MQRGCTGPLGMGVTRSRREKTGTQQGRSEMFFPHLKSFGYSLACVMALACGDLPRVHAADGAAGCTAASPRRSQPRCAIRRAPRMVETQNFRCYGFSEAAAAGEWANEFERLRRALYRKWLDREPLDWSPKCEIALHATLGGYLQAVGSGQASTIGATTLKGADGKIVSRRIDIRADRAGWLSGALAHELTHVILADEFAMTELPPWADEGMAVLADPTAKQALHLRDFDESRRRGSNRRLAEFLVEGSFPRPEQIPVFYGQSFSLVKYLAGRKTPAEFVRFLHRARQDGYDAALRDCYGLMGVADLERQWLRSQSASKPPRNAIGVAAVDRVNLD